jgi:hypothetical protein
MWSAYAILAPISSRYTGPAMTLANMRSLGVRAVDATCGCGRSSVDAASLPGEKEVPLGGQ